MLARKRRGTRTKAPRRKRRVTLTRHAPDGRRVPHGNVPGKARVRDSGLTLHSVVQFGPFGRGEGKALAAALEKIYEETSLENDLARLEREARATLREHGLPAECGPFLVRQEPDGRLAYVGPKPETLEQLRALGPGHLVATITSLVEDRPHTQEWFAAEILSQLAGLRAAIARGPRRMQPGSRSGLETSTRARRSSARSSFAQSVEEARWRPRERGARCVRNRHGRIPPRATKTGARWHARSGRAQRGHDRRERSHEKSTAKQRRPRASRPSEK